MTECQFWVVVGIVSLGAAAVIGAALWYLRERRRWVAAFKAKCARFEADLVRDARQSPQMPPRELPPSPPPMADMTYDCHDHYYDGCPNCGRGKNKE